MRTELQKRTKIVCTMGPAVDSESTLKGLIEAGMDIARLNFSHGSHEEHLARINRIKKVRRALDTPTAIMLDTAGPSVRTGTLEGGEPVLLQAGKRITLTERDVTGTERLVHQNCPGLAKLMAPGSPILIDDGLIELAVDEVDGTDIVCTVQNSGMLGERKSMNFPDTCIDLPILSEQDESDLLFGIEQGVDSVAVSFVRDRADVEHVRSFLDEHGGAHIDILSKIENARAVENLDDIIGASDGIIVARGDLGVEVDTERVPHIQKRAVALCNASHTPVVIATQMLDSMMRQPRPTRAEVADVANAVYDGADAVMLSGETAIGKYSVPAVHMMARILASSEQYAHANVESAVEYPTDIERVSPTVGRAAVSTADAVHAACIVTPTTSGRTARLISNLRPKAPIYAVAHDEWVMRRMQLYWGVTPMMGGIEGASLDDNIANAQRVVLERGLVAPGDLAVFTSGDPKTGPQLGAEDAGGSTYVGTSVMYVVQVRDDSDNS